MDLNATIIGQSISFILFILFCMKFIWPKIMNTIATREQEIIQSLSNIKKSKKDLELLQKKKNNIIYQTQQEAHSIIKQANYTKLVILEEAKLQAEKEKKKILLQMNNEITIQKEQAKHELINQISFLAIQIAEKIIKSSANEKNNIHLINQLIKKL
ncbi:F0F1 ATP synthase subunit B [Buchnera aphidicola]|uniref:F0F1 ATP synthase subunit B n=1 Tax=Buchnera aphidicola TaxID=9 RepID=UPI002239031F|nr:F0F1 ATP synthase subunit B [Buchnera aphidicola (Stegophylla sp.)]